MRFARQLPSLAPSPVFAVALLLAGSGFCALVYQVAWFRLLRLVFGASTAASAAVLAIFMGGLGWGSLVLGRRADRHGRPLGLYSFLELGISLAAAASPWLVALVHRLYIALGGTFALGLAAGTGVRLLLSTLVLALPTFLMGGTLPAVARAVERASDRGRRDLALLYGANTVGAVAGVVATTFLALEHLGIQATIWAAAGLNLAIAVIAYALARRAVLEDVEPETAEIPEDPPPEGAPRPAPEAARAPRGFVPAAAAVVGFAFFLMELTWYRTLAPILGGSSYTFGLILAVALAGIGAGGLLYGAGSRERRPTLVAFALTCSLEALALVIPFALGDRIAVLALLLQPLRDAGFPLLVGAWTAITVVVVLPAAVVAGYQFPLLVAVLGTGREKVGREVGRTYAANTLGAIVGSVAGGFGLLPLLTAPGVWRLVVVTLVALAGVSIVLAVRGQPGSRRSVWWRVAVPVALGVAALGLATAPGPTAFWRHSPIGAGRMDVDLSGPNELRRLVHERRRAVIWEAEGVESSVALEGESQYIFLVNGKADGSALRDAPNMVMSVLVGGLLHPGPRDGLVIGLGTGTSAGWMAEIPGMERVEVVELEPSIVHVAELCSTVNHDVLRRDDVELLFGDGRELLLTTDRTYDLIFSQPSNPYRAGISSLFSREFYRAAHARLNRGGLLLQWLQGYEVDAGVVRMAYATLGSVFPYVESWQVHRNDLLLVASTGPLVHDLPEIRRRVAREPFRSALEQVWGVRGVPGLYSGYVGDDGLTRHLARIHGGEVNTDDRPLMEFGFMRSLGREGLFAIEDLRRVAASEGFDRPPGAAAVGRGRAEELRSASALVWGGWPDPERLGPETLDAAAVRRVAARAAYRAGDLRAALARWRAQPESPLAPVDELLLAESLAEAADPAAPDRAAALGPDRRIEIDAILGRWHLRRGEPGEAARRLAAAFTASRDEPWVFAPLLARALQLAPELAARGAAAAELLFDALGEPFSVRLLEELRWRIRAEVAEAGGLGNRCTEAYAAFEPHVPWEGRFLLHRFRCYRDAGHPLTADAHRDVERFLELSPPRLERGLLRGGR